MMNELYTQWTALAGKYTEDKQLVDELYNVITQAYSSKDRHYHNLHHIHAMLKGAGEMKEAATDLDSLCFAIWYHDIVYNSLKHDNEEKSAEAAADALAELNYPAAKIGKVKQMILRTKKHMDNEDDDTDTGLLLDLDLAILGADRERYKEYMKQVRDEYSWVPGIMYRQGRKKVLQSFLDAPRIYRLDRFREKLEEQARANLRFELEELS